MRKNEMEVLVSLVVTKRWADGGTLSLAYLAEVPERQVSRFEVPLGDDLELATALEEARWNYALLRVPSDFFSRDDPTKQLWLRKAVERRDARKPA
jgi:hypothetical protein